MFREFVGTVPQEQTVLRLSERIRTCSDRENATAVPHQKESRTKINEKPPTSFPHGV